MMSSIGLSCAVRWGVLVMALVGGAARAAPSTNIPKKVVVDQGFMVDDSEDDFARLELLEKPATFDSWGQRLDFIQNNFTAEAQGYIDGADRIFIKDSADLQPVPHSRFRLGTYLELEEDGGLNLRFSPDFEVDINIPNLEHRLNVFLDTATSDELPGTTPTERDRGFNAGLRKATRNFNVDAGVNVKWLPELFARVDWRPHWTVSGWKIYPVQRVYWESEDGYGSVSSLDINGLLRRRWLVKSTSAVRWREVANDDEAPPEDPEEFFDGDRGFEWEQSLSLGYVTKLMSVKDRGRIVSFDRVAEATGIRASLFGHTEGDYAGPDRVRVSLGHRRPIYKNWIFLVIVPEVEWYKEFDWEFVPRIRVGFDMLFQAAAIERGSR
jgi:hypothetical protein